MSMSASQRNKGQRGERELIGIERDQRYFEIACRRIEDAQRQVKLFEDAPARPVMTKTAALL